MYPVFVKVTTTSSDLIKDSSSIVSSFSDISVFLSEFILSLFQASSFDKTSFSFDFDDKIDKYSSINLNAFF